MPRKAKELSALEVSRLKEPGLHFVGGVPGLALQIAPSGARTWVLRASIGGKRREMGLGGYSQAGITLARAREGALEARSRIGQGIDPIEDNKAARSRVAAERAAAKTFEHCGQAYIAAHESAWRNAKHQTQWQNTLTKLAYPVMGSLLVRDIGLSHVMATLEPIWQTKTETASRLRGRIELVLDWATARGYREGPNPARWRGHLDKLLPAPRKITRPKHYAALPASELGAFMVRLRDQPGMGARALEFAILTAARSGEVRGATWTEVDLDEAMWRVPAERMKAGREHRVPLSKAAVKLLRNLPRMADTDLVFPAPRGGKLSDMTLVAVLRRMEVSAVAHGFRSTFRDWVAETTNYPNEVAEMALAHTVADKVEASYRRGDLLEKRRSMMEDWAAFCEKPKMPAKVLPMRAARRRAA